VYDASTGHQGKGARQSVASRVRWHTSMSATAQFLARAAAAYKTKQGHVLADILLPDLEHPDIAQIIDELLRVRTNNPCPTKTRLDLAELRAK